MMQKHRISTDIGKDQKVTVELNQDYDQLEILSLKFSQKDIYTSLCADYGVVCGRITANDGFGIPNARVSVFVQQNEIHADDPVISKLYPYQEPSDRDENNYRYNLLPARQQHGGHAPTGTFPDQSDILTREEVLEVYENYYRYTVKTNSSGDFMIWGVPVGKQVLHVDLDLSDIGCFSLRPYDFIKRGEGIEKFERYYRFKSSTDLDGLPQIIKYDRTIEVFPFWGNLDLCEIGLTRVDYDISQSGIKIEPISLILTSTITDDNDDAVKKSGVIRRKTGYKCNLQTTEGKISAVRYTGKKVFGSDGVTLYPQLEYFYPSETIDEDGSAMVVLPMNMEYVYTNEFGEQEITNDTNKCIATTTIARFKFTLTGNEGNTGFANYLVPQIREYNTDVNGGNYYGEYEPELLTTYQFSDVFEDYLKIVTPNNGMGTIGSMSTGYTEDKKAVMLGTNNGGVPEDVFYKFIFGKVYTVSSFQGSHYEVSAAESFLGLSRRDAFLGIKEIRPNTEDDCSSKANYFPTNFAFRNRLKFGLLIGQVLLFVQFIFSIILIKFAELIGGFFWSVSQFFYDIYFGWPFEWRPFERFSEQLKDLAYRLSDRLTQQLSLTIYPDCEECTTDDSGIVKDISSSNNYCRIGEANFLSSKSEVLGVKMVLLVIPNSLSSSRYKNLSTDITLLPDRFIGQFAKDNEGGCSGTTSPSYSELNGLSALTTTIPDDPSSNYRYYAEFYSSPTSGTDGSFTPFIGAMKNVQTDSSDFKISSYSYPSGDLLDLLIPDIITNGGGTVGSGAKYIIFSSQKWLEITGVNLSESGILPNNTTIRIYDRATIKDPTLVGTSLNIETGCQKYDKFYNESSTYKYFFATGEYGSPTSPLNPPTYSTGYLEQTSATAPSAAYSLLATISGGASTRRLPYKQSWYKISNSTYDRKTKSGLTEIRDGVFTIIPVIDGETKNTDVLLEWYRRKRVGLFFCGGVVNYSFIDNWLNGVLYFFKFDRRIKWDDVNTLDLNQRGSKFPRELIFYNILDQQFYYRATPYNPTSGFTGQQYNGYKELLHPTTFYDVGVRDEFLYEICQDPRIDPTCSVIRDITPSSYQDPANIVEYAINYRLDISNAKFDVGDFFTGTGLGSNVGVFDGDITQLISINCEAGIEAFDLDSTQYFIYNGELMDPEDPYFSSYFKSGNNYSPIPIDLKLDNNGAFIRQCLNFRLGDYTQKVPFFLWNKGGTGFGPYSDATSDQQHWERNPTKIATEKLQRLFSISGETMPATGYTTNYLMADGEEEYLLKPMTITHPQYSFTGDTTDALERFENISEFAPPTGSTLAVNYVEGDVWLHVESGTKKDPLSGTTYVVVNKTWTAQPDKYVHNYRETFMYQTQLNYSGNKQVLSTPFLFYFGLRPDKTALDALIKYYGPKGAFPPAE